MKRKNQTTEYYYKSRCIIRDTAFDFISEQNLGQINGKAIYRGKHFKLTFLEALLYPNTYLKITHIPSQNSNICINITSDTTSFIKTDKYYVYETHALTLDKKCLYIGLENINLLGFDDQENVHIYRPMFDLGIGFFNQENYKRLEYIAPDEIFGIDAFLVPQNIPLYSKKAGKITSSSVYKYLGYFIPPPYIAGTKRETNWTLQTKDVFIGWKAVRVRIGAMKEDDIILAYLNKYKTRTFNQTGYTVHPQRPKEWGASPDGIILVDGEKRTIEFKASTLDANFRGHYIAQVIWEMACLDTSCGELVKYCEQKQNNNRFPEIKCRVATIKRDLILQKEIETLVDASKRVIDSLEFKILMQSSLYINMREKLDEMAQNLEYKEIDVPRDEIDKMYSHMKSVYQAEMPKKMYGHPLIKDIEDRQMEIFREIITQPDNYCKKAKLKDLIIEQIKDYTMLV